MASLGLYSSEAEYLAIASSIMVEASEVFFLLSGRSFQPLPTKISSRLLAKIESKSSRARMASWFKGVNRLFFNS
ncbi:MAG: hypothetical protein P8J54_00440 [SAR86 cluster bacterium]|nr:hypothetical protein [SAR86 cluster bacterium]